MSDDNADHSTRLRAMISGYMISQIISATAALGLADLLAEEPKSVEALAKMTKTYHEPLARLLRALSALGLTEQSEKGIFELTSLGALLRSDVLGSLRPLALMQGGEGIWRAWGICFTPCARAKPLSTMCSAWAPSSTEPLTPNERPCSTHTWRSLRADGSARS